jgi:ATP synthase protein I
MADQGGKMSRRPVPPQRGSRAPGLAVAATGGFEFALTILAGLFVGWWLDRRMGTGPWLLILGVFAGAAGGFYNLYRALTTAQRAPRSRGSDDEPPLNNG